MEHNRKPNKPSDRGQARPDNSVSPIPINIKQLAGNLEAARSALEANIRGSLTDGGRADVLSQKILNLLDSLSGSRQRVDDATFILGMAVVNLDRHHSGSTIAPPELDSELQQRYEHSAGQVRLLESKMATSQAVIEDLRNQLTAVNNELAAAILNAGELKVAAARSSNDAAARLEAMNQRVSEIKNLSSQLEMTRNDLLQSRKSAASQAEESARKEAELQQSISELRGLVERQEAAKKQLDQDLTKTEAEKLRTMEVLTERCAEIAKLKGQLDSYEELLNDAAEKEKALGLSAGSPAASGEIAKLLEQIQELKAKIREQETTLGRFAAAINKSNEVIKALEARNAKLEAEAKKATDTVAEMERKIQTLNQRIFALETDYARLREAYRKYRDETDEKLEESTEENRSQVLEINALRDANSQAAKKAAEATTELKAKIGKLEAELAEAKTEVERLNQQTVASTAQVAALEDARRVAEGLIGGLKASGELFTRLMGGAIPVPALQPAPFPYDPAKLIEESERRRLHQVRVEDRIADTEDALNRLELETEALENLPGKTEADQVLLREKVAERKRINAYLDDLQKISEGLSSDQTLLLRFQDAQQLMQKGLPGGLIGGELPAIPEIAIQTPQTVEAAKTEAEPAAEVKAVEPPDQIQGKQLALWKLAKEHELTQETVLIATLYDQIPGKRRGYALKHVIESAALAGILQRFGWGDEQVHQILHEHWRGAHKQLRQSDRYLPISRGSLPNAFVRTQLLLPWDASLLLTGKEIAEFQRWFQTSFK